MAADGTPLAFAYGGPEDSVPIVCCNGVGVSTFFWDYIAEHFVKTNRVVVWDYRGHGASGDLAEPMRITMPEIADDLARVMDACNVEQAVLLGHSMGCQVILQFAESYGDRVLGLVPILGAFGRPADTFIDPRIGEAAYKAAYKATKKWGGLISRGMRLTLRRPVMWQAARWSGLVHPDLCKKSDLDPYMEHMSRLDPRVFMEFVRAAQEHDASDFMPQFHKPVLVVAGERDLFTPRHLSVEMASRLAQADLLEIPRGSHAALIEQPELINLRLEKFLKERINPAPTADPEAEAPSLASIQGGRV